MNSFFKPRFVLLTFLCFGASSLSAHTLLPARFSSDVYASDRVFGQANAWIPLSGKSDQAWYLNPQVAYGADGQGYLDLGLGYRWLSNQKTLLGVYLFGGYSNIAENRNVWTMNPGVEMLGRRWDARMNGYLVNEKNQNLGYWFGYQVGRKNLQYKGYGVYDDLYFIRQHHGNGVDAQMGYQPWDQIPFKASLGGYFFAPDKVVKNVVGGVAELEYWLDQHFKLLVSYNYDNVRHSVGAIGLGIELGGTRRHRTVPQCVQERITDPIERNLAQQGQGSGVISQNTNYFMGPYPLTDEQYNDATNGRGGGGPDLGVSNPNPPPEPPPPLPPPGQLAHLVYFSANGSPNNTNPWINGECTREVPCGPAHFTQDNVNAFAVALPNTLISFSLGTYPANGATTATPLTLVAGQEIHGRTLDYMNPAPSTDRPTFSGTLQLNTGNIVSDIKSIYPGGVSPTTGISLAQGAVDIVIENSQVGSESDPTQRFNIGIGSAGSGPFNNETVIKEVTIFAGNTGINFGGPSLIVRDSVINAGGGAASESSGIRSTGQNATIELDHVNINMNSSTANLLSGLQAGFLGTTMIANDVTIQLNASNLSATAVALYVGNSTLEQPTSLTVNRGNMLSNNTSGPAYIIGGVENAGSIVIDQATLTVESLSGAILQSVNIIHNITSSTCSVNSVFGCP